MGKCSYRTPGVDKSDSCSQSSTVRPSKVFPAVTNWPKFTYCESTCMIFYMQFMIVGEVGLLLYAPQLLEDGVNISFFFSFLLPLLLNK